MEFVVFIDSTDQEQHSVVSLKFAGTANEMHQWDRNSFSRGTKWVCLLWNL